VTAITAYLPVSAMEREIKIQDRVRVPDGDTGTVIGFYRHNDTALVLLDCGDKVSFPVDGLDGAS
jgi:hypothetical protein